MLGKRGDRRRLHFVPLLACALLMGGCGPDDPADGDIGPGQSPATEMAAAEVRRGPFAASPNRCDRVDTDTSQSNIPEALTDLRAEVRTVEVGDFIVDYAAHPLPYPEGSPWSHWGKGLLASNGKFYSAVGDHGAEGSCKGPGDGNTFLYEYDPETKVLRAVGDALTAFGDHRPGDNGFGKVHGQIDEGPCGLVYLHTYWGSADCVTYNERYRGDILLRYNPWTEHLESLGSPFPAHGTPSTNLWREGGLLYGEANAPGSDGKDAKFWVWDTQTEEVRYREEDGTDRRNRNIAVDLEGRAYLNDGRRGMRRYDPEANEIEQLDYRFDSGGTDEFLRASTEGVADGTMTLVTQSNTDADGSRMRRYSEFYHFDPGAGRLQWIAHDDEYVGDVVADPTARVVYYTPGAHQSANEFAVIELNRTTGEKRTLFRVGVAIRADGGPQPGGSYSVSISPDGKTLYFVSNSSLRRPGLPMIVVIHIPESEMP